MSEAVGGASAPVSEASSESSSEEVKTVTPWDDDEPVKPKAESKAESKVEAKPKVQPPKMRKIKVDGQEEFVNEDDVFKDYQKYKASDKRMAEAARMRQETEEKLSRIKEDPYGVLRELGLDPTELSESWLRKHLEDEFDSDPRDKEMRALQKRLEEFESRDKEVKEKEEMTQKEKFIESRKEALSKTLAEAMESTVLSKHPETQAALLREMATYMRAAKENGEDVSAQELAEYVQNNRFKQYHLLANQFEGDQLIDFLGEGVINKIRKADLERLKAKRQAPQSYRNEQIAEPTKKRSKYINPTDLRFAMRDME